ncbi:uncharacterized protein LOC127751473 [Frankliniella occidentalis]|uniref:Uncharacterized protein LOC127751472 n=1 Tax=Frankliniella occidentalis TaxID=133901 RepID=A0A9C6XU41_FRAOC|nr:uncharacterized protein LOC127751472 [Frankliniella occidentalis]XP_052131070.1 uncharacterized protein LOC127751473 [Frankliniella occidentalis]
MATVILRDTSPGHSSEVEVMRSVLRKSGTGRYLLALSKCPSPLSDSDQNKLAQLIIDNETVQNDKHKITATDFEEIVKIILNIFPKESAVSLSLSFNGMDINSSTFG